MPVLPYLFRMPLAYVRGIELRCNLIVWRVLNEPRYHRTERQRAHDVQRAQMQQQLDLLEHRAAVHAGTSLGTHPH
eukprot:COSAG05_NODE_416_length_10031_cov_18.951067_3_plen_76_part_00